MPAPLSNILQQSRIGGKGAIENVLKGHPQETVSPDDLTDFTDYPKIRKQLFDNVAQAVTEGFPVKNDKYTLKVTDVAYHGPERYSLSDHKKALLENRTLSRKLTGRYELVDNATGQVVQKSGRKTLMNVPYLTDTGTFVRNGSDLALAKQMRLVSGAYTRVTADGYPETQFNVKPRTGLGFRTYMEPETSVFYLTSAGRKVPLYPLLQAMQIPDEQLSAAWGKEILEKNKEAKTSPHAVRWIRQAAEEGRKYRMRQASAQPVEPVEIPETKEKPEDIDEE
jgi:DNA-directed RNA polymerase beta subunit